jgi:hypothetical protein
MNYQKANIYTKLKELRYMPKFLDVHSLKGFEEETLRKIATVPCR